VLAWLLQRSPSIVSIRGTLSIEHLKTNLAAPDLELSDGNYAALNGDVACESGRAGEKS
jgi:aryl-alcohol dehydrogenase-like predicted oxidoreductase